EEDKLTRANGQNWLPQSALSKVLETSGLQLDQIQHIARAGFHGGILSKHRKDAAHEAMVAQLRRILAGRRFSMHEHHLCHAASAYYCSDSSRALILSLDYGQHGASGLIALGEDDGIKPLHYLAYPNSFGWFYSRCTELVGLRPQRDEHKLQWLSRDGVPRFHEALENVFVWNAKGLPALDRKYFSPGADKTGHFSPRLFRELELSRSKPVTDRAVRAAIARSAQDALETWLLRLAEKFRESTCAESMCLSGGVFQNVMLVRAL